MVGGHFKSSQAFVFHLLGVGLIVFLGEQVHPVLSQAFAFHLLGVDLVVFLGEPVAPVLQSLPHHR